MPQLTFPFDLNGMFVDVLICPGGKQLSDFQATGLPLPHPVWGRGVIDTGTNVTAVSLHILQRLGIPQGAFTSSQGIGGPFTSHYYEVSLSITDKSVLSNPSYCPPDVSVIHLDVPEIDVLIGLDLLMACVLTIDGPARRFTLDF